MTITRVSIPRRYFGTGGVEEANADTVYNNKCLIDLEFKKRTIYGENQRIYYGAKAPNNIYHYDTTGRNIVLLSASGALSVNAGITTNGFNAQTTKYVMALNQRQNELNQQTQDYLIEKIQSEEKLTATVLRNKGNWGNVKRLVVRDELMKLQIGNTTDLPLEDSQIRALKEQIIGRDLSDFSDRELTQLIDDILKPDKRIVLQAFKNYKNEGIIDSRLQIGKLDELKNVLKDVDLDKITAKELKKLMDNYWEKLEVHHRTSISSDASKQSDINNLDTLNTTQHDKKHTYINQNGEEKIDYTKPLEEGALDRQGELQILNRKRVMKNELMGLGAALLIGAGTGFAIGFVVGLAQNGINPNCIKNAFVSGAKSSAESIALSAGNYAISRTIGTAISENLSSVIASKIGETVAEKALMNISKMCTMGTVGALSIVITSVYQFSKLKIMGYSTKECLLRTGKTAAMSFSVLTLSIIVQGVWGGPAGIVVSIASGIIITGTNIVMIIHDRDLRSKISLYIIRLTEPQLYSAFC